MIKKRRKLPKSKYYEYINSESWRITRRRYFSSKMPQGCFICGRNDVPLDVHHLTYKTLGHENLTHLRTLCRSCHNKVHEIAKENEISLWRATLSAGRPLKKKRRQELKKQLKYEAILPPIEQLENKKNWNAKTLRKWGILWPPQKGWFKTLKERVYRQTMPTF